MLISKFGYNKLVRMNNVKNDHISKQQQTSIDKRGKEIHENGHIRHIDNGVFCVQSQTHNDTFYDVVLSEECDSMHMPVLYKAEQQMQAHNRRRIPYARLH